MKPCWMSDAELEQSLHELIRKMYDRLGIELEEDE